MAAGLLEASTLAKRCFSFRNVPRFAWVRQDPPANEVDMVTDTDEGGAKKEKVPVPSREEHLGDKGRYASGLGRWASKKSKKALQTGLRIGQSLLWHS